MEKKEKRWQRRGMFALVSNRRSEALSDNEDALFPAVDEDAPEEGEQDR